MWESLDISDDSEAPGRLKQNMTRATRRKRYDRLPLRDADRQSSFAVRMPRKIKVAKLGSKARPRGQGLVPWEENLPSLLAKARDAYVNMMLKTADTASATSVVPVVKKPVKSLKLGSGFGKKVQFLPTEVNLGFKLNKIEKQYLDHLKRTFDDRYA